MSGNGCFSRLEDGPPKDVHVPIPGTCGCHLIRKQGLCGCDQVKDLGMERLSWIIRVGPKCNHKGLRREKQGEIGHKGGNNMQTEAETGGMQPRETNMMPERQVP